MDREKVLDNLGEDLRFFVGRFEIYMPFYGPVGPVRKPCLAKLISFLFLNFLFDFLGPRGPL